MDINNYKKPWAYLIPSNFNLPIGKIHKTSFTIGRSITCDLILHDPFISHKHITINKRSHGRGLEFTLVCHSKNKIYLNTNPITDSKNKVIKNNDQIWLVNRNVVSNCRTIGFLFKTEDLTQSSIVLQKYDRELASLQMFTDQVKSMMKCTRCNQLMVSPISLHPCSHKLCQNCAIWMIENLNDKCLVEGCSRKILTLMEDKCFSNIVKAYNRYKFGEDRYTPSFYFSQNPFLMQNWMKYNNNKNKYKSNSQKVKSITTQKELSQNHEEQSTAQIHSSLSEQKQHKNMSVNKPKSPQMPKIQQRRLLEHNKLKSEKPIQFQGLQQLYHVLAQLQMLKAENPMEELQSVHQDAQIKSSIAQSSTLRVKELKVENKIPCRNCHKTIPFSLKNIENKQCIICLHQFCNKEFPPCKNLEEPLKSLSQRLIIISKEHVLGCLQQNLKTIVNNILMANIRKNSEISYVFQYVLLKNSGFYTYSFCKDSEIKRIDINFASCICDKCWPSIALQLLLSYLKFHQSKLKMYSRKDLEQTISYVAQVKKQRK